MQEKKKVSIFSLAKLFESFSHTQAFLPQVTSSGLTLQITYPDTSLLSWVWLGKHLPPQPGWCPSMATTAWPRHARGWASTRQSCCSSSVHLQAVIPPAPTPCPKMGGFCWDTALPSRANAAPAAAGTCISGDGALPPWAMVSHAACRESRIFSSLCNTPENHLKCPDRPRLRSFLARGFPRAALPQRGDSHSPGERPLRWMPALGGLFQLGQSAISVQDFSAHLGGVKVKLTFPRGQCKPGKASQ